MNFNFSFIHFEIKLKPTHMYRIKVVLTGKEAIEAATDDDIYPEYYADTYLGARFAAWRWTRFWAKEEGEDQTYVMHKSWNLLEYDIEPEWEYVEAKTYKVIKKVAIFSR